MSRIPFKSYLFLLWIAAAAGRAESAAVTPFRAPPKLTFAELLQLAVQDAPQSALAEHLERLLSEPFISNEASLSSAPRQPHGDRGPGSGLRVAEWNIERGLGGEQLALSLSDARRFEQIARAAQLEKPKNLSKLKQELAILQNSDIIILDEVDLGMKRTQYRDVAKSLAQALHFNYTYGVEFVELHRLYLGEKKLDLVAERRPHDPGEVFGVDPNRYLGLEGTAILSRYPIRNARIVRLPECYDWFHGEIQQVSDLERVKRWSAERIFEERVRRQVRRGGRMALIANIEMPDSPTGDVTVVAPHLENYCPPECRRGQMDYLLDQIRDVDNPLILGGDLNTSGHDQTPTSFRYEFLKRIRDYRFWAKKALSWFLPVPFAAVIEIPLNYFKNHHDPTALNVPLLLPNPEKALFRNTRAFRFADGGSFDFAGQKDKTIHRNGRTLAQSNQRAWKGFAPTFSFERTFFHFIGSYKLDWFFVKPATLKTAQPETRAFVPYDGRTLKHVNSAPGKRISDHRPITIDLSLTRPAPPATPPHL